MKLTTLLLIISLFEMHASSYSQNTKVSLNLKEATVEQVFREIESKTEFRFLYKNKEVELGKKVSIIVKKKSVKDILKQLFVGTRVEFAVYENRQIILSLQPESKAIDRKNVGGDISENVLIKEKQVSGKVIDKAGMPMAGVNVKVVGTKKTVNTNIDGNFTLMVEKGDILEFSYLGMKTKRFTIQDETQVKIVMEEEVSTLNELVVVGYGKQKKASVTGSVASLKGEVITKVPSSNITGVLAGRLPGLIVKQTGGRPGSDVATYNIRGFGANGGGAQGEGALVIVDGVQRSFSQLDPNEIEDITVLKDASAAVYGVKAGAGVILITTKRGVDGKPVITYNSSYSFTERTRYPEFANFKEYGAAAALHRRGNEWAIFTNSITPERLAALQNGTDPGTNWFNEVSKNFAPLEQHNLNIRGGNEAVKYFLSGGYLNQGSMWKSGDFGFQRFNTSIKLDAKISKNLSSTFDLGARREQRESSAADGNGDFGDMQFAHPAFPATVPGGRLAVVSTSNAQSPLAATTKSIGGSTKSESTVLNGSFGLKYKIPGVEGLTAEGKASVVQSFNFSKRLERPFSLWAFDGVNFVNHQVSNGGLVDLTESNNRFSSITTNLSLNYQRQFGEHSLSVLMLSERNSVFSESVTAIGNDLISAASPYLDYSNPDLQTVSGNASEYGNTGIVGRVNYDFKDKYLLELSFRRDKSPYFPEATRTGFFPGASIGWVLSKEGFMSNVSFVKNLKIRASVSKLGNDGTNSYDFIEGFSILKAKGDSGGYVFDGKFQTAIRSRGIANPDITWQNSKLYNAGIDASFFNNKLTFEFDAFYRLRYGLLERDTEGVTIPITTGASLPYQNLESHDNRGFETTIGYQNSVGDFKYNVSGNFSWAREKYVNEIETLVYTDKDLERISRKSGQWVNRTFGYQFDGFFTQEDIINAKINYDGLGNTSLRPGDIKIKDYNGDGKIDVRDQVLIGRGDIPEIMFAFNTQISYKNFDFSMFWQGAANFEQNMSDTERGLGLYPSGPRTPYKYVTDRLWSVDNKNGAEFPSDLDGITNFTNIDKYRIDSKYVRLKNVVLGYTLPKEIVSKIGATSLRFSLTGTNLLTFDRLGFYPYDPESSGTGAYPIQRSYSFGINLSF